MDPIATLQDDGFQGRLRCYLDDSSLVFAELACFFDFFENLFGNAWFEIFPEALDVRKNLAVALECFASVVENRLVHLQNLAEKILRGGAVYIAVARLHGSCFVLAAQRLVFRGQTWMGEHSAPNHHACEFRILALNFTDLRNGCDAAVINERVATFCIKFFERIEVDSSFVLLLAESRVERDLRERRFV